MPSLKIMKYAVYGRVQGVYFRNETVQRAKELGVAGWVQNNLDGSVGGEAIGEHEKLQEFHDWLKEGPSAAKVEDVKLHVKEVDEDHFRGIFERRRGRGAGGPEFFAQ